MAKKPTKPRTENVAADRQAPVAPKWDVLYQSDAYVVIKKENVVHPDGRWNKDAIWAAKEAHPGQDLVFHDQDARQLSIDKARYNSVEGGKKFRDLKKYGMGVALIDFPKEAPIKSAFAPEAKPARLADVDPKKVKKVVTSKETLKADNENFRNKKYGKDEAHVVDDKPSRPGKKTDEKFSEKDKKRLAVLTKKDREEVARERRRKRQEKRAEARAKLPKRVITRTKHGAMWDGKLLGANQHVAKSGRAYYTSKARTEQRAGVRAKRSLKSWNNLSRWFESAKKRVVTRKQNALKDAARRRVKESVHLKALKAQKALARAGDYGRRVRALPGFGTKPVKMLMQSRTAFSGNAPGKRAAMKNFSREQKYPGMKHAENKARSSAIMGRQILSGMSATLNSSLKGSSPLSGVKGTSLFTTGNTLVTPRFPDGGNGIFFRIDAASMITALSTTMPAAIQNGIREASGAIGRKMLDIVEPYVPKDTGLLYSSAETNVDQTAAGLVDMEGGEAYPTSQMFGVSISYNAPYAERVYYDMTKRHGKDYNDAYDTAEKDDRETARWIEVAFQKEKGALQGLLGEYARAITAAMSMVGWRQVSFTRSNGSVVNFWSSKS